MPGLAAEVKQLGENVAKLAWAINKRAYNILEGNVSEVNGWMGISIYFAAIYPLPEGHTSFLRGERAMPGNRGEAR